MKVTVGLVMLAFSAGAFGADVYVCKGSNGTTAFQQDPCPKTSKYIAHGTYTAHLDDASQARLASQSMATPPAAARPTLTRSSTGAPIASYSQQTTHGGIGSSAYQRDEVQATQCTAPDGHAYYTTGECKQRSVLVGMKDRDWHSDHVEGVPGAVMIAPDLAIDPDSGNTIHLQHESEQAPVYTLKRDAGVQVDPDAACAAARSYSQHHYADDRAAARARDVCRKGRSLWDLRSSGAIPQGGGG